jgi:hypothetical protein
MAPDPSVPLSMKLKKFKHFDTDPDLSFQNCFCVYSYVNMFCNLPPIESECYLSFLRYKDLNGKQWKKKCKSLAYIVMAKLRFGSATTLRLAGGSETLVLS